VLGAIEHGDIVLVDAVVEWREEPGTRELRVHAIREIRGIETPPAADELGPALDRAREALGGGFSPERVVELLAELDSPDYVAPASLELASRGYVRKNRYSR
jgi:hypothetical protein